MKWASTVTEEGQLDEAVAQASRRVLEDLGELPDLVVVFASAHYGDRYARLSDLIAENLGDCLVFGCSASGVIGGGREIEHRAGFSLTAAVLPGVQLTARHVSQSAVPERHAPLAHWAAVTGVPATSRPHFLLLADPFTFNPEPLLSGLDRTYPGAVKIGGLASGARSRGEACLFLADEVYPAGLISLAFEGNVNIDTIVAQGCRPIGEPLWVTKAHGSLILELDGRRPIEMFETLYQRLDEHDQALCRNSLFVGLTMRDAQSRYAQGDYLVRNLVGSDSTTGALAVAAELHDNQIVQFHVRDANTAAYDLEQALARLDRLPEGEQPCGTLLFSCVGRGMHLYGCPDHDSHVFARHVGDVPLGGFFCNGEIAPVQNRTFVHGYTSAFALFRG